MTAQFMVALALAIPVVVFPVAFIWYLGIAGLYLVVKERRGKVAAGAKL